MSTPLWPRPALKTTGVMHFIVICAAISILAPTVPVAKICLVVKRLGRFGLRHLLKWTDLVLVPRNKNWTLRGPFVLVPDRLVALTLI